MVAAKKIGAGLIMYRFRLGKPEIFLVHPGGPFWKNKDDGVWSIPKGNADEGEIDLLEVAKQEFKEETGFDAGRNFASIGVIDEARKTVHVWGFEGDCDPAKLVSNTCEIDWPPRSGKKLVIPEVDRGAFFDLEEAERKLAGYQRPIIQVFKGYLHGK